MTPEERAAAEAAFNVFLAQAFQTAVILFAIQFFVRRWWRAQGLPGLPVGEWARMLGAAIAAQLQGHARPETLNTQPTASQVLSSVPPADAQTDRDRPQTDRV